MTTTENINSLEDQARDKDLLAPSDDPECIFVRDAQALREAAELIRIRRDQLSNAPLTLEELQKMGGEPVYVHCCGCASYIGCGWALVDTKLGGSCKMANGCTVYFNRYGENWLAYRHKPEEGK